MGADGGRFGAGSLGRGVFLGLAKGSPGPGDFFWMQHKCLECTENIGFSWIWLNIKPGTYMIIYDHMLHICF